MSHFGPNETSQNVEMSLNRKRASFFFSSNPSSRKFALKMPTCVNCRASMWFSHTCSECKRHDLCSWCVNYCTVSADVKAAHATCRSCFRTAVAPYINLDTSFEACGPAAGSAVSIVLVHGGGGSRAMYRPLAKALVGAGFRCVLADLPAHGGLMDSPLTIDTACTALQDLVGREAPPFDGIKPLYLGGSLGGYIGMELLGRQPDLFSAAMIICAEQTVGEGASLAAAAAIVSLRFMLNTFMTSKTMTNLMISVCNKHKFLDQQLVDECSFKPGMYFHNGMSHCDVLRSCKSVAAMLKFLGPVCYLGGSLDHHDMADSLLATSKANEQATKGSVDDVLTRAVRYEGGDHFFSHDTRFRAQFEQDILKFATDVVSAVKK